MIFRTVLCKLMALHLYAQIEMQTPARLKEEEFVFKLKIAGAVTLLSERGYVTPT